MSTAASELARDREARIISLIQGTLAPLQCHLTDESAQHAGHAGAASGAGHFRIIVVSTMFEGQKRIERHRLVYDCLRDMMHTEIHALAITALAPSEVAGSLPSTTPSEPEK